MWEKVIEQAILLMFAVATPFALVLIHKLVSKFAEKLHIQNAAAYDSQIDMLVMKAVDGIEKVSINAAKDNAVVHTGEQKMNDAITWVNGELVRLKLPVIEPDKLATRVEAELLTLMPVSGQR